jgi:hypothetical protein
VTVLNVISLGAGVQSTTMALMAAHGEITPMPDAAIFADTGDEPQAVYEHLAWLRSANVLPFPIHIVSRGRLSESLFAGDDSARIPFFVGAGGMANRQCTRNFKLRPIRRKARELLGDVRPGPGTITQWIGISLDEAWRMKPSGVRYVINRWPLVDLRISRGDCLEWLKRHDYPEPPKSACVYCPYQSDRQWRSLEGSDRELALSVDERLRSPENVARFRGELFAHRSRKPLGEVDLSTAEDRGQINLFMNECEGLCGT